MKDRLTSVSCGTQQQQQQQHYAHTYIHNAHTFYFFTFFKNIGKRSIGICSFNNEKGGFYAHKVCALCTYEHNICT